MQPISHAAWVSSHVTAIKTISRLKRGGVATGSPSPHRGVFLTETGQALAERLRARHRLVVNVLLALGVPTEAAETDAEGMDHYVSDSTLRPSLNSCSLRRDDRSEVPGPSFAAVKRRLASGSAV